MSVSIRLSAYHWTSFLTSEVTAMIKDENERKYLFGRFPEIKKEKFRELELEFLPQYLIYKKSGSRYDCLCTRCRKKFTVDDQQIA